ncbi:hypothetical protein ACGFIX_19335 [Nocardia salmonicida]|uniref:hypothetical protein n=1 Tax=Nocardia salmonicida TaxID=53431 RepID=UPI0037155825
MDASTSAAVAAWAACASAVVTLITVCVTAWFARKQVEAARGQVQAAHEARLQQDRHAQEALAAQAQLAQATLEHEAQEAQKTRDEQAQPNVVMFIEQNPSEFYALELVVKNFGATPAYNVRLNFDPKPKVSPHAVGDTEVTDLWYPDIIPILAPEQEWRTLWDLSHKRFELGTLPSRHEASVSYTDSGGKAFLTESVLDWESLRGTETIIIKTVHDVAKQLKKQNEKLDAIATALQSFALSSSGVWVYSSDGAQEQQRRHDEAAERRRQRELVRQARIAQAAAAIPPTPTDDQTAAPRSTEAQSPEQE